LTHGSFASTNLNPNRKGRVILPKEKGGSNDKQKEKGRENLQKRRARTVPKNRDIGLSPKGKKVTGGRGIFVEKVHS